MDEAHAPACRRMCKRAVEGRVADIVAGIVGERGIETGGLERRQDIGSRQCGPERGRSRSRRSPEARRESRRVRFSRIDNVPRPILDTDAIRTPGEAEMHDNVRREGCTEAAELRP